jgi:dTDP-glucose 4,6-dehydratase
VSTDEVYGSLGETGKFTETTPYAPNSPYSASKAASDHLVRAFHHTYGLPVLTTNCSNNYGPYQFPEKLIPLMIAKALAGEPLPVYGDGATCATGCYVATTAGDPRGARTGRVGEVYNVGGDAERENIVVVNTRSAPARPAPPARADGQPRIADHLRRKDRPGHDRRYAIDASKLRANSAGSRRMTFEQRHRRTVDWYLANQDWVRRVLDGSYRCERIGAPHEPARERASSSPAAPARGCIRSPRRSASSCCRCTTSR